MTVTFLGFGLACCMIIFYLNHNQRIISAYISRSFFIRSFQMKMKNSQYLKLLIKVDRQEYLCYDLE